MTYAAIPTTYKGINMRSRLEAKWACMFDQFGWQWEYEPFDLNGWIPDFLIKNGPIPGLIDVKPHLEFDENIGNKIVTAVGPDDLSKWELIIFAAAPFLRTNVDERLLGWRTTPTDCLMLGWHFKPLYKMWGDIEFSNDKSTNVFLHQMWAHATNVVQWKAPRVSTNPSYRDPRDILLNTIFDWMDTDTNCMTVLRATGEPLGKSINKDQAKKIFRLYNNNSLHDLAIKIGVA